MIDSTIAIVQEALQAMGHEPMPLKIYEFFNSSWSTSAPPDIVNHLLDWTRECIKFQIINKG